jgi:hypothetical protein
LGLITKALIIALTGTMLTTGDYLVPYQKENEIILGSYSSSEGIDLKAS